MGESPRLFYFTIKITFYFFKLLGILDLRVYRNSRFKNSSLRVYRNSSLSVSRNSSLGIPDLKILD